IQQEIGDPLLAEGYRDAARIALEALDAKVARLAAAGELTAIAPRDARRAFHAMCEGFAAMELRGFMPPGEQERVWREGLSAVVRGCAGALCPGKDVARITNIGWSRPRCPDGPAAPRSSRPGLR